MPPTNPNIGVCSGDDTIVALSTPPGRGGIAVIRMSGEQAVAICGGLAPSANLAPRTATLADVIDTDGNPVDQALVTLFPKPSSYTGENVIEVSTHGSPPVVRFVIERAMELGARLAEPGEFTRRAYLNGRMDLVQAEGVRDLIDAVTLYQARVANRQIDGALSAKVTPLKNQLIDCISLLEAGIDFAEDDIDVASDDQILARLAPLRKGVERLVAGYQYGKVVRSGLKLAIVGRPNVGKSSLFNRLLEKDRAIVTPTAGTTRDAISETASFDGIPVELVDTAGIRTTGDEIESEGVERSWQSLQEADLALVVTDLSAPDGAADKALWLRVVEACDALKIGNKVDLVSPSAADESTLVVSAKTGAGLDRLRQAIRERALPGLGSSDEGAFVTNIRHEGLLRTALQAIAKSERAVSGHVPHEMLLLDLYEVLQPLDQITGATTLDDILDNVFSTFCIGK